MNNEPDPPPRRSTRRDGPADRPTKSAAGRCEIVLQNPCRYPEAGARRWRPWLGRVVDELAPDADSLAVRFASDRELRRLNRRFRQRDQCTDVLSFPGDVRATGNVPASVPGDGFPEVSDRHLGDVAVAVPTARRQAQALGHSVERELRVLLLHAILHCLGYDHTHDDGTMERLERRLRPRFVDHD